MEERERQQVHIGHDVHEEESDFLADVVTSNGAATPDTRIMFSQNLGGSEAVPLEPWRETDRLIALGRDLQVQAKNLRITTPYTNNKSSSVIPTALLSTSRSKKRKGTSHFWPDDSAAQVTASDAAVDSKILLESLSLGRSTRSASSRLRHVGLETPDGTPRPVADYAPSEKNLALGPGEDDIESSKKSKSHFFTSPESKKGKSPSKRPPRGTVSCVPFPPLTASRFGIVQERYAHEPFWLLIVITFLIRTKGKTSVPVFHAVKERFPSPEHLADPANAEDIMDMIRHLGLSTSRLSFIQKYARLFMEQPPEAGKVYRVRNYDRRDTGSTPMKSPDQDTDNEMLSPRPDSEEPNADAWEIGHMTKGKYALDSWRIFCRDELLGRAEDWNGKGREAEFQPEWMRVMPHDKELRACLRWMWMREGWEWNPYTGERVVLRPEMQRAVNEGRVEYDDTGGLSILDRPAVDVL